MPADILPCGPDLRRHPLAGRNEMAERAKRRRLRQARFEQAVIDGWHAQQHARLEALHRLGDARRGGPTLQQDVARAHAERREHVADRIGEVKPRGREQAIVLRAAENLLVILGAHPDIAVMMLDRLRHTGRAGGHHPKRRVTWPSRHRNKRHGRRAFPGGQVTLASDQPSPRQRPGHRRHGHLRELAVDHQRHRADNTKDLLKLLGTGAARYRDRDGANGHRGEMHRDKIRRVEHQHANTVAGADAGFAEANRELADALFQRAIAQRLAGAEQRRMLRPRNLEPVQQAIFDGIHYGAATTSTISTAGCAVGSTRASLRPAFSNNV